MNQHKEKILNFTGERLTTQLQGQIMVEHLHRYAIAENYIKNKDVLDIACGEGYGSSILSKQAKSVVGVDISEEAVNHSKQKYRANNLKFKIGSTSNIPLADNSVDVVVSFETIEHHNEHEKMMLEIKRVLKTGGILIISSPNKLEYSDRPKYINPFHIKELYKDEFRKLVKNNFKNTLFLNQRCLSGSLIVSEHNQNSFTQYSGDYENINQDGLFREIYNIAIASDTDFIKTDSSIFESEKYYQELNGKHIIERYTNTTTWKIGRFILAPYTFIKKILSH